MLSCDHRTTLHRNEQEFVSEAAANKKTIHGLQETVISTLLGLISMPYWTGQRILHMYISWERAKCDVGNAGIKLLATSIKIGNLYCSILIKQHNYQRLRSMSLPHAFKNRTALTLRSQIVDRRRNRTRTLWLRASAVFWETPTGELWIDVNKKT